MMVYVAPADPSALLPLTLQPSGRTPHLPILALSAKESITNDVGIQVTQSRVHQRLEMIQAPLRCLELTPPGPESL